MFWRAKPIVSDDMLGWIEENFDWVEDNRPDWMQAAQLFTPTRAHFDIPKGQDQATAQAIADRIAELLRLEVQVRVDPLPKIDPRFRHEYGVMGEVAGEYYHDPLSPVVRYNPELMERPLPFINTMVHELIHARLSDVVEDLPGGEAAHELATDLHCIIAGFGCIQMQAAEQDGWAGYMTQPSRAVALALFLQRHRLSHEDAVPYLSPRPRKWLGKACKMLEG